APDPDGDCTADCVWQNFGSIWNTAAFYRDPYGQVHLKGLVCRGATSPCVARGKVTLPNPIDDIFTLPAGYRPEKWTEFATSSNGEFARVIIEPNGTVNATPPFDYEDITLDDIQFRSFPSGQDGFP